MCLTRPFELRVPATPEAGVQRSCQAPTLIPIRRRLLCFALWLTARLFLAPV
ncbi:hypothetical protein BX600DRAFT_451203 [Xylariales sp. PMI_506]|nr:hypothetical protein BX600DRAFT_451203 [Xylariales sp. PMI_506]